MTKDYSFSDIAENVFLGAGMLLSNFTPRSVKTSPATYGKIVNSNYTNVIGVSVNALEDSETVYLRSPEEIEVEGLGSKPIMLTAAMFGVFSAKSLEKMETAEVSDLLILASENASVRPEEEISEENIANDAVDDIELELPKEEEMSSGADEKSEGPEETVSFDFGTTEEDATVDSEDKDYNPDEEVEYNFNVEEDTAEEKTDEPIEEAVSAEVRSEEIPSEEFPSEEVEMPDTVYSADTTTDINQNINLLSTFNEHMKNLEAQKEEKRLKQQSLLSDLSTLEEEIKSIEKMQQDAMEKCKNAYQTLEPTLRQLGVDVVAQFGVDPGVLGIAEEQYENNSYQK